MGLFDVNYDNLVVQQTPVRLRNNVMVAWLRCLIAPVKYLAGLFSANRKANLYRLAHDGQVCYLEAALNDTFDNIDRGIYISDPAWHDPVYLYERSELKPVYLYRRSESKPVYLYTRAETYALGVCFIVNVPVAVVFDTDHMKALIDLYRLPGKRGYSIVTY